MSWGNAPPQAPYGAPASAPAFAPSGAPHGAPANAPAFAPSGTPYGAPASAPAFAPPGGPYGAQGNAPPYAPSGAPFAGQGNAPQGGAPAYPPLGGSQAYQSYNQAPFQQPQGPPPGIAADLWQWFQSVDLDRSGKINSTELRSALMNGNYSAFSEGTCRLMIRLFDRDQSGTIDIHEFSALWKYIGDWRICFDRFDRDRSGTISTTELAEALNSFGYRLSPQFYQTLVKTYAARRSTGSATEDSINFDDFIEACVTIKNLTETFRRHDQRQQGVVTMGFEQFLDMVVQIIV